MGVVFSPEDTWNQQPVIDYGNILAKVHISVSLLTCGVALLLYVEIDLFLYNLMISLSQVNSTGVHIDAAIMECEFKDDVAHFWLQAVEDQSCDLSWLEGMQPLNGLVIQKYVSS